MRKTVGRCAVLLCTSLAYGAGQNTVTNVLSSQDRELVELVLTRVNRDATAGIIESTVLVHSTAPMCTADGTPFCIRSAMLSADEIRWDFPDATALRDAFSARNQEPVVIGALTIPVPQIPRATLKGIFTKDRYVWPELVRRYPKVRSLAQVGSPAYSRDGSKALIYVEEFCNPRCGGGSLLLLEWQSGHWAIARSLINWVE